MFGLHNFPRKKLILACSLALIFSAPWSESGVISSGARVNDRAAQRGVSNDEGP